MRAGAAAVALALVVLTGGRARADHLQLHAERCASLDPAALDLAVRRELDLDPEVARRVGAASVAVVCADGIHARVQLAPEGAGGPVARDLDLSEEPPALRVKLVALAIAELVDIEAAAPEPAMIPRPSVDPEDAPPARVGPVRAPVRPVGVTLRGGMRLVAGDADPMATIAADLDEGVARVGLVAALGDGRRESGRPYILAITLARTLACSRGQTSVCLIARAEGGFAGASFRSDDERFMDHSVYAGYGDLTVGFEIRRRVAGWNWVADVDLGAADGLIVESPYLEHLDGPFAVAALGMTW